MAIEERIGFQVSDAIANLNALNASILQVNASIRAMNSLGGRSRGVSHLANSFTNVANSADRARNNVNNATNAMQNAGSVGTRAGQSLTISWETFARVILTQAIVRGINKVTDALGEAREQAFEFQQGTARIAAVSAEGAAGLEPLRDRLLEISDVTGQDTGEVLTAALEGIQNELGDTETTLDAIEGPFNKLARVTGSDLVTAVNAASSVIKAYNLDAAEAGRISDILFATYNKGVIELEGLEGRLGTVNNQASALGIGFEEVAGALAALTLSGNNTSFSLTQLRNIQNKLIKPGEDLAKVFKDLGVASGRELVEKFGGLEGSLKALLEAVDGNERKLGALFGSIRGQLGILGLSNNAFKLFDASLKEVRNSTGSLDEAFRTFNQQTASQFEIEVTRLKNSTLPLGEALGDLSTNTVRFINRFIEGLDRLRQRKDIQRLEQLAVNFGRAFISVIDDIIDKLDVFLRGLGRAAAAVADIISRITNPVGATEDDRIDQIRQDMQRLQVHAANAADSIRQSFAARGDTSILGDQQDAFDTLAQIEQQARITVSNLNVQFLENEANIRANTTAFEGFKRSLESATAPSLFGNVEGQRLLREELQGISAELEGIINRSATAQGAAAKQLEQELNLQRQKIQEKSEELGLDNKAILALTGQANAAEQVLKNQQGKAENEKRAAEAATVANQALQNQIDIANAAGVSLDQLGLSAQQAGKAVADIPNPSVNASAAIAQMNALRDAAIAAAQAVAAAGAGGGGGFFHGGVIHRQSGGSTRGQDTVPALLSPGEFVINRRSSSRFFSQLQAMNAGQSPAFRETGGPVTNVGDINVNVSGGAGGENPTQTARQIAIGLRRELRRKTSRLS